MSSTLLELERPDDTTPVSGPGTADHSIDTDDVLAALEDPDCRAILAATDDPLTARELIDAADVPRSTVYRKVDVLTDAGLLTERIRLSTDGKHASEYRRAVDDVTVRITTDGGVTVGISPADER